jgi:hypothetical protein
MQARLLRVLGKWISTMPDEPVELAKINITYRRDPGASEVMTLSDGASEVVLYLSPLGGMNMLLEVIDALLQLIPYEGEHIYYWEGDQDYKKGQKAPAFQRGMNGPSRVTARSP